MSLPRKLTRDEILAATKEELRIAIAERLGWKWGHPVAGHVWADGSVQDESEIMSCLYRQDNIMWRWGSIVPDTGEYPRMPSGSCVLPNWPADIAAADALLDDLESRSGHWELASLSGGGYQLAVIIDTPAEIRAFRAMGKTRPEAICRAWLKATAAQAMEDQGG